MQILWIKERIRINKNTLAVFNYTQDYTNRLTWDTFLKLAELINGATEPRKGVNKKEETEVRVLYSFTLRFPFTFLKRCIQRNLKESVKQRLCDLKNCIEKI